MRALAKPLPAHVAKDNDPRKSQINDLLKSIASDLVGINAWRYQRQISAGLQEFVEAVAFEHYLSTQSLISLLEARSLLPPGMGDLLMESDYLLGIYDTIGEIMRFAITGMATAGSIPGSGGDRDVLSDLRTLRTCLEALNTKSNPLDREVIKKAEVMRTCVEKVETSVYGMIVRGRERPKGWIPEAGSGGASDGADREMVESY